MLTSSQYESKYLDLIDQEIWTFIDRTTQCFPVESTELSIEEQRHYYNQMCQFFQPALDAAVNRKDTTLTSRSLACREYTVDADNNANPIVIYYHGGGFVVGNLDSHDDVCAQICKETTYKVIACDYRLAPEHQHPAAFEDALSLFEFIANTTVQPVLLVGDSAGATLAAAVSAHTRTSRHQPHGQVLIYPYLGASFDEGSAISHAKAPMLSTEDLIYYEKMRFDSSQNTSNDVTLAPLKDTNFSDLPPTAIFCAECDPVCDDGPLYAKRINQAGGTANCDIEKGLVHGYLRARHSSSKAEASFTKIVTAIKMLGTS